jgi:superfamily II DNA or RNA helicase
VAIARPYQEEAVSKAVDHLVKRRAATLVLPTGAGKTVIAAFFVLRILEANPDATFLFLQHTEELLVQNMETLARITGITCSVVMADKNDWSGQAVFASVPTLSKVKRLGDLGAYSHMLVDECHHSAADSWLRVIHRATKRNPKLRILALSATPDRGDGKPLSKALGKIVHRVYIQELIDLGHLVPPRAFSVVMGDAVDRISGLRGKDAGSGDQTEVAKILDTKIYNEAVVAQWKARADGRPTVAFCSTVEHAKHVAEAFNAAGIPAAAIDHRDKEARRQAISDYKAGRIKVLTNCLLLTEGFDFQPTSCVIVLRAMLHPSTFIQALGRALRVVDAEKHPGVLKYDAVCLDFSGAASRHSELDTATILLRDVVDLHDLAANDDQPAERVEAIPAETAEIEDTFVPTLESVNLVASQFRWTDIHRDGRTLLASGLSGFAALCPAGPHWVAFGREWDGEVTILHYGARGTAFAAASDWIRRYEKDDRATGNRRWLNDPVTEKQFRLLQAKGYQKADIALMNKYEASCQITYINERERVLTAIRDYLALAAEIQRQAA